MACVLAAGWFSFPLFAAGCFILGSIESIYMVAYESFYPLLIVMLAGAASAVLLVGGGKRYVEPIYNRQE